MSDPLVIKSHRGSYSVIFDRDALSRLASDPPKNAHFVIDSRVAELHRSTLAPLLGYLVRPRSDPTLRNGPRHGVGPRAVCRTVSRRERRAYWYRMRYQPIASITNTNFDIAGVITGGLAVLVRPSDGQAR